MNIFFKCPYCTKDSAGNHDPDCPLANQTIPLTPTGWICPVCGRGCSPWESTCPCRPIGYEITCLSEDK